MNSMSGRRTAGLNSSLSYLRVDVHVAVNAKTNTLTKKLRSEILLDLLELSILLNSVKVVKLSVVKPGTPEQIPSGCSIVGSKHGCADVGAVGTLNICNRLTDYDTRAQKVKFKQFSVFVSPMAKRKGKRKGVKNDFDDVGNADADDSRSQYNHQNSQERREVRGHASSSQTDPIETRFPTHGSPSSSQKDSDDENDELDDSRPCEVIVLCLQIQPELRLESSDNRWQTDLHMIYQADSYAFYSGSVKVSKKGFRDFFVWSGSVKENGPDYSSTSYFPRRKHRTPRRIHSHERFHFIIVPDKFDGHLLANGEVEPNSFSILEHILKHCAGRTEDINKLLAYVLTRVEWGRLRRHRTYDATECLRQIHVDRHLHPKAPSAAFCVLSLKRQLQSKGIYEKSFIFKLDALDFMLYADQGLQRKDLSELFHMWRLPKDDPIAVCIVRFGLASGNRSIENHEAQTFQAAVAKPLSLTPEQCGLLQHCLQRPKFPIQKLCSTILDVHYLTSALQLTKKDSDALTCHVVTDIQMRQSEYTNAIETMTIQNYLQEWKLYITHIVRTAKANNNPIAATPPFSAQALLNCRKKDDQLNIEDVVKSLVFPVANDLIAEIQPASLKPLVKHIGTNVFEFLDSLTATGVPNEVAIEYFDILMKYLQTYPTLLLQVFYHVGSLEECGGGITKPRLTWLLEHCNLQHSHSFLTFEREAVTRWANTASLKDVNKVKGFLQKGTYDHVEYCHELYMLLWMRLFNEEARRRETKYEAKISEAVNPESCSAESTLYTCLVQVECNSLMKDLITRYRTEALAASAVQDAVCLAGRLESGMVKAGVVDFFTEVPQAAGFLREILDLSNSTTSVTDAVESLSRRQTKVSTAWKDVMSALTSMKQTNIIERLAEELYAELNIVASRMTQSLLCDWEPPKVPDSLKLQCSRLTLGLKSTLFLRVWCDAAVVDNITKTLPPPTKDTLFEFWVDYCNAVFREWHDTIARVLDGHAPLSESLVFLKNFQPSQRNRTSEYKADLSEEAIRAELNKSTRMLEEELRTEAIAVTKLANNLNKPIHRTIEEVVQLLTKTLELSRWKEDIGHLNMVVDALDLQGEGIDKVKDFANLSPTETCTSARKCLDAVVSVLPNIVTILPGYIQLFHTVVVQQGLLKVFLQYRTLDSINRRIDARQGEEISLEDIQRLTALRSTVQKYMAVQDFELDQLRKSPGLRQVVGFLAQTCATLLDLRCLNKHVEGISQILSQGSDEMQSLTIVKSLLSGNGVFLIQYDNRAVDVYAVQNDGTVIPPDEFGSLRSRLVLASGVVLQDADGRDVDVPLPLNIGKAAEKEMYVARFSRLFDQAFEFSHLVQRLANAGHPDHQRNKITLPCSMRSKVLQTQIEEHAAELERWKTAFENYLRQFDSLSYFNRSQLVECLSAMRVQPVNVGCLYSNLLSLGCQVSLADVEEKCQMLETRDTNDLNVKDLFQILHHLISDCVRPEVFAPMPECVNVPPASDLLCTQGLYSILRIAHPRDEEVVVGLHVAKYKRLPLPIEILFCSPQTLTEDISDFFHRWFHAHKRGGTDDRAMFWIVQVDTLQFDVQQKCIQTLLSYDQRVKGGRSIPNCSDRRPLLVLTAGNAPSYITRALARSDEASISQRRGDELVDHIKTGVSARDLHVVWSSECAAGKTRSVITQLVVDKVNNAGRPLQHAQLSIDVSPIKHPLALLSSHRPLTTTDGIVLHFNVGHKADRKMVSRFILQYAILGCWFDGIAFARHPHDHIVFELCNTGMDDERERIPVTKHFKVIPVEEQISSELFSAVPSPRSARYTVLTENVDVKRPCKFTVAFSADPKDLKVLPLIPTTTGSRISTNSARVTGIGSECDIETENSQAHVRLGAGHSMKICALECTSDRPICLDYETHVSQRVGAEGDNEVAPISEPRISVMHTGILYEYVRGQPPESFLGNSSRPTRCAGDDIQGHANTLRVLWEYDRCVQSGENAVRPWRTVQDTDVDLCDDSTTTLMKRLSDVAQITAACKQTYLRRFFKLCLQIFKDMHRISAWELADFVEGERSFLSRYTFHILELVMQTCKDLAKPMMTPLNGNNPLGDASRCEGMHKFADMQGKTYVLTHPMGSTDVAMSIVSFGQQGIFQEIETLVQQRDGDPMFLSWLQEYKIRDQSSMHRCRLQALCDRLTGDPQATYGADVLKFLQVVGVVGPLFWMLTAAQELKDSSGLEELDTYLGNEGNDTVKRGVEALRDESDAAASDVHTVGDFLRHVVDLVRTVFGFDSTRKPTYRLTVDLMLRLVAMRIRMLAGTPVCLMGETGCGKTEMISFLSKLTGRGFHVVNVQEGMSELDLLAELEPVLFQACRNPGKKIEVVLDEANTTSSVWYIKDLLCDGICNGFRLPPNIGFVVIMNPWKRRTAQQQQAIAEMDVGGLNFLKYQQAKDHTNTDLDQQDARHELVYQVHSAPETMYSHVWDFGSASRTFSAKSDLGGGFDRTVLLAGTVTEISDEMQLSCHMVQWLEQHLRGSKKLLLSFSDAGDADDGNAMFWLPFRTIVVELVSQSQRFLREQVYFHETSVVSIRDIYKACDVVRAVFLEFWPIRERLQHGADHISPFRCLTESLHCALITTYCLRLDETRRARYVQFIHREWCVARERFPKLHADFLPAPALDPSTAQHSDMYISFCDLASFVVSGITIDSDIAQNEALKENCLTMLLAIYLKSALFIVGRPGSTKSRSLELLCNPLSQKRGILSELRLKIQKHVVQCSPDTTAVHVNMQARAAASFQYTARQHDPHDAHRFVLVLEEVGATIGSKHNPLMSLHGLIDHGVLIQTQRIRTTERIAIVGLSNYSLDASKMGRGHITYRGNPSVKDLQFTAERILRDIDEHGASDHLRSFATAFSQCVLSDEQLSWFHGMRDFYASVKTTQCLAQPLEDELGIRDLSARRSKLTSHVARWTVMINLSGFPHKGTEAKLFHAMLSSFDSGREVTKAVWTWTTDAGTSIRVCDACCRLQLYRALLAYRVDFPTEELDARRIAKIFTDRADKLSYGAYHCEFFDGKDGFESTQGSQSTACTPSDFCPEIIAFSLWNVTARHPMVFTHVNAALSLLESLKLVNMQQCTVIFRSLVSEEATSKSELVQQMMRVRAAMREGHTLILVKSRHVYESLLDALNGHYVREENTDDDEDGEILHRTMLSLAGETKSVYIKPSFRCIVLESINELKDCVLPPFINRFNKTELTYRSCLSPHQRDLRSLFLARMTVACHFDDRTVETVNVFSLLAPGCGALTVESALHIYATSGRGPGRDGGQYDPKETIDLILCLCMSQKNHRRLQLRLVEGLVQDEVHSKVESWYQRFVQRDLHRPFVDVAAHAFHHLNRASATSCTHLAIITEQIQVEFSELCATVGNVFNHAHVDDTSRCRVVGTVMMLNHASLTHVQSTLHVLQRVKLKEDESAVSLFVLDHRSSTQTNVDLNAFMFTVSSMVNLGPRKHVAVIVNVCDALQRDSEEKLSDFSFAISRGWCVLNVDEVVEEKIKGPAVPWIACVADEEDEDEDPFSLYVLDDMRDLHEVLSIEAMATLVLQPNELVGLAQKLAFLPTQVEQIIQQITTTLVDRPALAKSLLGIAFDRLKRARIPSTEWMPQASKSAKNASSSLRSIYIAYLSDVVSRMMVPVLHSVVAFGSLQRMLDDGDCPSVFTEIIPLFVPEFDVRHCIQLQTPSTALLGRNSVRAGCLEFVHGSSVAFPLSPLIAATLAAREVDPAREARVQQWGFPPQMVLVYVTDLVRHGLNVPVEQTNLFLSLIAIERPDVLERLDYVHAILQDGGWVTAARRFCNLPDLTSVADLPSVLDRDVALNKTDILDLAENSDGIVPLQAIELLRVLFRGAAEIPWWALRAGALAMEECKNDTEKDDVRRALRVAYDDPINGVVYAMEHKMAATKLFVFEYFNHISSSSTGVREATDILSKIGITCTTAPTLRCALALLIRKALLAILERHAMADKAVLVLERLHREQPSHDPLVSHCLVDILTNDEHSASLDRAHECVQEMEMPEELRQLFQCTLLIAVLYHIICGDSDNARLLHQVDDILGRCADADMIRNACLFTVRQLSDEGCSGLDGAIARVRSGEFSKLMARHNVLEEIEKANQKASPLACFPDFRKAVSLLSSIADGDENCQQEFQALQAVAQFASMSVHVLDIAPNQIDNFYRVLQKNEWLGASNADIKSIMAARNDLTANISATLRQLVLHAFGQVRYQNSPHIGFMIDISRTAAVNKQAVDGLRKQVEEIMNPRCPRCQKVFQDWDGCFAVTCTCGCGFCGICLQDCGTDAHAHCLQAHGNYHFSFDTFKRRFGDLATTRIRALLDRVPDLQYTLLANEIPKLLEGNMFYVRPEAVLVRKLANDKDPPRQTAHATLLAYNVLLVLGQACLRLLEPNIGGQPSWAQLSAALGSTLKLAQEDLFPATDNHPGDGAAENDSAAIWIHAVLHSLPCGNGAIAPMTRDQCLQEIGSVTCRPLQTLMSEFTAQCVPSAAIFQELRFDSDFEPTPVCWLFRCRNPKTEAQLENHVEANPDVFPLFRLLLRREESLRHNRRCLRAVRFLGQLQSAATQHGITKVGADKISYGEFIDTAGISEEHVSEFAANVTLIMQRCKLNNWQCQRKLQTVFEALRSGPRSETSLSHFLPATTGAGIFAKALWGGEASDDDGHIPEKAWVGIGIAQNEIVQEIWGVGSDGELSPYIASDDDIVSCDIDMLVPLVFTLYVEPGFHPEFSSDIAVVERLLKFGSPRLSTYMRVPAELPDFAFLTDAITELLNEVDQKLTRCGRTSEVLPHSLVTAVYSFFTRDPGAPRCLMAFGLAAAKQLRTTDDGPPPELVGDITFTMPLTHAQDRGRRLVHAPSMRQRLKVAHLGALVCSCWDGDGIHYTADAQVPADDVAAFDEGLELVRNDPALHVYIPAVLCSLRYLGLTIFGTDVELGTLEYPLGCVMEDCLFPAADDDDDCANVFLSKAPFALPSKHFGAAYRAAIRILGPMEAQASQTDACGEGNVETDGPLPFAVDLQFIRVEGNHASEVDPTSHDDVDDDIPEYGASGSVFDNMDATTTNADNNEPYDDEEMPTNPRNVYVLDDSARATLERPTGALHYD